MKRGLTLSILAVIVVGSVMVALVAAGTFNRSGRSGANGVSASTAISSSAVTYVALPQGYPRLTNLAAGSDGSIWGWASSLSEVSLFHWTPGSPTLSSIPLGAPSQLGLITGIQNAIAIDPQGDVWLGANMRLVSVNPSNDAQTSFSVPALPTDAVGNALRPQGLQGLQAITALAAGPNDELAIAVSDASSVDIMNTQTGKFQTVNLPTGYEATDLAYATDGTLGIDAASLDPRVGGFELLVQPTGAAAASVAGAMDGSEIAVQGNEFYTGGGATTGNSSGQMSTNSTLSAAIANGQVKAIASGAVTTIPGGFAIETSTGLAVVGASAVSELVLPSYNCAPASGPLGPSTEQTAPQNQQCAELAKELVGTQSGIIFVPSSNTSQIGYVPTAAVPSVGQP